MPKRKYIPQQELYEITDQQILAERQIVLELIRLNQFNYIKSFKDSDEHLFSEISDILSKATKKEQIFIKNYFILPDELKADHAINKSALRTNPHIYLLMNEDLKDEHAVSYAEILMQTDGSYLKYLIKEKPHLIELKKFKKIALNAISSCPTSFKDLPLKYKVDELFIKLSLNKNPLVYCQLTLSQQENPQFLPYILNYMNKAEDVRDIYRAMPKKYKANKKNIISIISFSPQVYGLLPRKQRADEQIAEHAIAHDYKQIKNVPKSMQFNTSIINAYFSRHNIKDIKEQVIELKSLIKSDLTISHLIDKIIRVSPKHKMKVLAKIFGSGPHRLLNSRNMKNLLKKSPQAFENLEQVHPLYDCHYSDIIELAIKLDYKNFRYLYTEHNQYDTYGHLYEDYFILAIKIYHANGIKDSHPYAYMRDRQVGISSLKKIITHKVDGKVVVDYENIFTHGSNGIKRSRRVYVKALNINPNLADLYPLTKNCKQTIFDGLNDEARKALFTSWIQEKGLEDVLEIAHLKKEILETSTVNNAQKA